MSESPDGTYVVTSSRAGLRYHRPTCKRLTESSAIVGDVLTYLNAETPAACCKPSPSELARQRAARIPEPAAKPIIEATARELPAPPESPQPAPAAIPAVWVRNADPGPHPALDPAQDALPLRSATDAACAAEATATLTGAHVAGQWLVYDRAAVPEVMGALTDWARAADKHAGMAVAVWAQLRRRHPDATDGRPGAVAQAIDALNDALNDGRLADWQPRMRSDESLDLWLVPETAAAPLRMRAGQALDWCTATGAAPAAKAS